MAKKRPQEKYKNKKTEIAADKGRHASARQNESVEQTHDLCGMLVRPDILSHVTVKSCVKSTDFINVPGI